jgi:hypothetical protein
MRREGSADQQLLRRLVAPPGLEDGVESLDYWRRRRDRLPWYRMHKRREAEQMIVRWEQRVGAALVSQHRVPIEARLSAGALIARTRLARWTRRARIALLATVATMTFVVTALAAAALVYLLQAI